MEIRKFVFGETLEKAVEALPEEYQLRYYRYIKNYGLHGEDPELTGIELSVWVQMKAMIDITMPKKNNGSPVSKGAPYGNSNAKKKIAEETIENNSKQINQLISNENKKTNALNGNGNGNEYINENGVCFFENNFKYIPENPEKSQIDLTTVFHKARNLWNELKVPPGCRDIIIPHTENDVLRTLRNYTVPEIENAIRNYNAHRTKSDNDWKPPPPYGSLYGFLKNGVARYYDNNDFERQFKIQEFKAASVDTADKVDATEKLFVEMNEAERMMVDVDTIVPLGEILAKKQWEEKNERNSV